MLALESNVNMNHKKKESKFFVRTKWKQTIYKYVESLMFSLFGNSNHRIVIPNVCSVSFGNKENCIQLLVKHPFLTRLFIKDWNHLEIWIALHKCTCWYVMPTFINENICFLGSKVVHKKKNNNNNRDRREAYEQFTCSTCKWKMNESKTNIN